MSTSRARFAHLHNHTEFSSLDAIQRLDSMCAAAVADGQDAIAMTDHGTLAGTWKFARAAKAAGIKPILGSEFYLAIGSRHERDFEVTPGDFEGSKTRRYMHLTVLARNEQGWRNLLRLNNASHDHYWYQPRIDLELLAQHSEGLVIGSGCLGGPVASRLLAGDRSGARQALGELRDIAGRDALFAEVMDHGIDVERAIAPDLVSLARDMGVPLVATNDAHYTSCDDAGAHDAWLAVGVKSTIDDPKRFRFNGHGYHLRTAAEMEAVFEDHPAGVEAVRNSLWVAESVDDGILDDTSVKLPTFFLPDGHPDIGTWGTHPDESAYLHHLALEGAKRKYGSPLPEHVKKRLRWEEDVIVGAGTAGYFLIVKDMIDAARRAGYRTGYGRGSAGGSVIGYVMGIHGVDPIANDLLFERFLDPTRVGLPDIDSDFDEDGAAWVAAQYLPSRWGKDKVARIGSFGMSLSRKAIRDVARVTRRYDTGDALAKLVPVEGGKPASFETLKDPANQSGAAFRDLVEVDSDAADVARTAEAFEGVTSGVSIHACGVLVSDRPLDELVPLRHERKKIGSATVDTGALVTQWDGPDVEQFGMLKLDDLAIRNLTIVSQALKLIRERTGEDVDVDGLDMGATDTRTQAAWQVIASGRTAGLFQIESGGMARLCSQVRPSSHDDLSAVLALYRPGPMGAGMHERFAARKHGQEAVDYGIFTPVAAEQEAIASVLDNTHGLVTYQEQLMRLSTVVAGFSAGERNRLRKAFSKKIKAEMDALRGQFIEGAQQEIELGDGTRSIAFRKETAANLWRTFDASASYLFNRSHSAAYAVLTFVTAYLKANWPAEYGAALLVSTDKEDKRVGFLSTLRDEGLKVLPPDVNAGSAGTSVDTDGNIRLGLAEVKGAGKDTAAIVAERSHGGEFQSLADLIARVKVPTDRPAETREVAHTQDQQVCLECLGTVGPEEAPGFVSCVCPKSRHEPREDDEARVVRHQDGSSTEFKAVRHKGGYRLRRTDRRPTLDENGKVVKATANLSVAVVEALIEAGACDQFGPRAGMYAAARALREAPQLPIPDVEWGVVERSARQRERLGVCVGEHPMSQLGPQVAQWGEGDGRRHARPRPVHRLTEVGDGAFVVTAGVVAAWAERGYSRGRMVHVTLEGSKGVVDGVVWDETLTQLKATGCVPDVGDVVALTGRLQRRSAPRPVDNETTPDAEPEPERMEMTVQQVWSGPLTDDERMTLPVVAPVESADREDRQVHLAVVADPVADSQVGSDPAREKTRSAPAEGAARLELRAGRSASLMARLTLERLAEGVPFRDVDKWLIDAEVGDVFSGVFTVPDGRTFVLVAAPSDGLTQMTMFAKEAS